MDARAIHSGVRSAVAKALGRFPTDRPFRAIEVGAGAGGAFRRWMGLLAPFRRVEFTATDADPDLLRVYREEAASWARGGGFRVSGDLRFEGRSRSIEVRFRRAAVPEGFAGWGDGRFEMLLAQSFWDLVPPGAALPLARRLLAPGGVFYAALTFSGETGFDPPLGERDRRILDLYHRTMRNARAGERLIAEIRAPGSGFFELACGRSDWRVAPGEDRFFLETLLGFVEKELRGRAGLPEWLRDRHRQLRDGRLGFTARQQDLAASR